MESGAGVSDASVSTRVPHTRSCVRVPPPPAPVATVPQAAQALPSPTTHQPSTAPACPTACPTACPPAGPSNLREDLEQLGLGNVAVQVTDIQRRVGLGGRGGGSGGAGNCGREQSSTGEKGAAPQRQSSADGCSSRTVVVCRCAVPPLSTRHSSIDAPAGTAGAAASVGGTTAGVAIFLDFIFSAAAAAAEAAPRASISIQGIEGSKRRR